MSSKCGGKADTVHTYTFLLFGSERKKQGEGQDTAIGPAPIHLEFRQLHHCFTLS